MKKPSIAIVVSFGCMLFLGSVSPVLAAPNIPVGQQIRKEIQEVRKENLENLVASAAAVKVWTRTRTGLLKATVTAIGTISMTVKTEDGKEYTVQVDNTTQWRRKFWGKSGLDETSVNDVLNVHGKWMNEERSQIQATLIRNMSIQKRNGVFFGKVKTLTSGGWVMTTVARGDQTVTVSGNTRFIDRTGMGIGQSAILVGHRVRVMGLWDSKNNTITEVSQVKDFNLPAKPTSTPKP
ncbi:DUF5666 domain-containing protein [Patescibacteria group bacterium]|nr:DUF5666 domain-containing protein [Patescibacteria group bacterium]